eukprot:TRINITY_DN67481_c0_g1_i1.p1 TRINITY_DN67481_c0_g1~~TRINITY_DN67481_c0_g1_i1.p1  ORF type:complete len:561 (+),score=75.58 TRINITY_DN67481_c0_g1_i1:114-1796(+)
MALAAAEAACRPLLQIAPMMEVTYRDFRYFMRLLTRRAQLWTEMVVDDTVLYNMEPEKCDRFLGYHPKEHPVVCQLGGSDAAKLAQVATVVERYGYDEVNLNVGCPSNRVAMKGEFGCSLMLRPELVRDIIHAMSRAVQIPVTVKCRLGVDDNDSPEFTKKFVRTVAQGGCKHFCIHSRKAWLSGLSPAQNRSIPPLHYWRVLDLCQEFPDLTFSINGGILDLGHARALLGFPGGRINGESEELTVAAWGWSESERGTFPGIPSNLNGVMIGRAAMNNPVMLWDVDRAIYGDPGPVRPMTRRSLLESYQSYLEEVHPPGDSDRSIGKMNQAVKPTLGVFLGCRGNKAYRNALDLATRSKEHRELGPAHMIAEAMEMVDATNPGVLDQLLARTDPYKPPREGSGGDSGSDGKPVPMPTARGRKRKGGTISKEEPAETKMRPGDVGNGNAAFIANETVAVGACLPPVLVGTDAVAAVAVAPMDTASVVTNAAVAAPGAVVVASVAAIDEAAATVAAASVGAATTASALEARSMESASAAETMVSTVVSAVEPVPDICVGLAN